MLRLALIAWIALGWAPPAAMAESQDNNVQWNGIFHYHTMRSPEWPAAGEPFSLELRVFHGDITGATVRVWTGEEVFLPMYWVRTEGIFEFWQAEVTGSSTQGRTGLDYSFQITDGSDTDFLNRAGMWDGTPPGGGDFFIDLSPNADHPLGATVVPGGIVFRLWAPYATRVQVAGSWDGWQGRTDLSANSAYWTGFVPGAAAGHEYRFRLNDRDDWWKPDARGRAMTSSAGNSIIVDPDSYPWTSNGYQTPYYEEMVIYELHVGTFSGHGDGVANWPARFSDLVDAHLNDLVYLGLNAVELLPVQESPGDFNWGYEPVCQFAVESAYGLPEDFRQLVDRCHREGIAVLLDVKYNAGGPGDNWLSHYDSEWNATYYYPEDSPNRNGNGVIGDRYNFSRPEVRDYLIDSALTWMREYRVDGFRLDHTALIKDLPAGGGEGWQFLRELSNAIHHESPHAIVIAEQWPNDYWVTEPTWNGGAGCDTQWHEAFKNACLTAFGTIKFPGASADMLYLQWAFTHPVVEVGTNAVNYVESHDEAGCIDPSYECWSQRLVTRTAGDVDGEYAIGRSKLAGGSVLFVPGIPMLFMGQEFMEFMVWAVVREPDDHRPNWGRKALHPGVYQFFSDAVHARRLYPALRSDAANYIQHVNDGADVMTIHRWDGAGDDLMVVYNYSSTTYRNYRIGFPSPGRWLEIINSDASVYEGSGVGNGGFVDVSADPYDGLPASAEIVIPRMGVLLFSKIRREWPDPPLVRPTWMLR